MRYLTFLAGAEGLEPSARGFGVDVETNHGKQGKAGATGKFSGPKRAKKSGKSPEKREMH